MKVRKARKTRADKAPHKAKNNKRPKKHAQNGVAYKAFLRAGKHIGKRKARDKKQVRKAVEKRKNIAFNHATHHSLGYKPCVC